VHNNHIKHKRKQSRLCRSAYTFFTGYTLLSASPCVEPVGTGDTLAVTISLARCTLRFTHLVQAAKATPAKDVPTLCHRHGPSAPLTGASSFQAQRALAAVCSRCLCSEICIGLVSYLDLCGGFGLSGNEGRMMRVDRSAI
jgi:hypothetical protein